MSATRWFIYTVLIGATPLIVRFFIFLFTNSLSVGYIFNEVDLVAFGLVLHVSNINELDGRDDLSKHSKTVYIGLSTFLIILFSVFLGIAYISDIDRGNLFNKNSIRGCTGILSIASLIFSYSIYRRSKAATND